MFSISDSNIASEASSTSRPLQINPVRAVPTCLHNPFETEYASRVGSSMSSSPSVVEELKNSAECLHSADSCQNDFKGLRYVRQQTQPDSLIKMEGFAVPAVAFPYATEMTEELVAGYALIEEYMHTLSCEISDRKMELPVGVGCGRKTLVLGLQGVLVGETGELRPHLNRFLSVLATRFEIVVQTAVRNAV